MWIVISGFPSIESRALVGFPTIESSLMSLNVLKSRKPLLPARGSKDWVACCSNGQFAYQRFYHRLAGGLGHMAGQPFAGTHRGGADQPFSMAHVSCGLLHGKELTARIDGQHMVEVLHTHLVKSYCEVLDAGVTHQHIELAILL
jgi:hypothetical protein